MSQRVFLIGWIISLCIPGGLAGWFTFGPALRNKAAAFTNYQQALGLPGPGTGGKMPDALRPHLHFQGGRSRQDPF